MAASNKVYWTIFATFPYARSSDVGTNLAYRPTLLKTGELTSQAAAGSYFLYCCYRDRKHLAFSY